MSNGSVMKNQRFNMESGELKQYLQALHADVLEDVDAKLQKGIDKIVLELELKQRKLQNGLLEKSSLPKNSSSTEKLPPKEFVLRNSTLTNLWENTDISSIYNACVAVYILTYIYIAIIYFFNVQRFKRDLALFCWSFNQFHIVMAIWITINLAIVFLLHPTFRFWAVRRPLVKRKNLYDAVFCSLFILFQVALLTIPARTIVVYNLPPIASFIVLMETTRLFMKSYAFVRENITRALKYKPHQDGDKESYPCPNVEKLVYFLFAPTLIYRDNYPRTSHIRWNYVAWICVQMIGCVLGVFFVYTYFAMGILKKVGVQPIPIVHFIGILGTSVLAGALLCLMSFYFTFHCWQNAFAELLRFGDRRFYSDWWNCTSYGNFLKSWNRLVHDWLNYYVYKDLYFVLGRSRTGALLTVFLISAIIHEYVLAICVKFLFPICFLLYSTFGIVLVFTTRKKTSSFWNVFILSSIFQGYGLQTIFYTLEWYARINCPRVLDSWQDYVVPRCFSCNVISFSTQDNSWTWFPSDY